MALAKLKEKNRELEPAKADYDSLLIKYESLQNKFNRLLQEKEDLSGELDEIKIRIIKESRAKSVKSMDEFDDNGVYLREK